jgi:hypothetical protein
VTGGLYTIGSTTTNVIPVSLTTFGGVGSLPTASWADATGTGYGWKGSVRVSDFTYTGLWTTGGTYLGGTDSVTDGAQPVDVTNAAGGAYNGTRDGVVYTVNVTSKVGGTVGFNWACPACSVVGDTDYAADTGGSVPSATVSNAVAVGLQGITIDMSLATSGVSYQLQAGTQQPSALSLLASASVVDASSQPIPTTLGGIAGVTTDGSLSADPVLKADATADTDTVSGPTTGSAQTYGASEPLISAAANTGMGSYTVNPGVTFNADVNSWAATYTANVQYSMVTGP